MCKMRWRPSSKKVCLTPDWSLTHPLTHPMNHKVSFPSKRKSQNNLKNLKNQNRLNKKKNQITLKNKNLKNLKKRKSARGKDRWLNMNLRTKVNQKSINLYIFLPKSPISPNFLSLSWLSMKGFLSKNFGRLLILPKKMLIAFTCLPFLASNAHPYLNFSQEILWTAWFGTTKTIQNYLFSAGAILIVGMCSISRCLLLSASRKNTHWKWTFTISSRQLLKRGKISIIVPFAKTLDVQLPRVTVSIYIKSIAIAETVQKIIRGWIHSSRIHLYLFWKQAESHLYASTVLVVNTSGKPWSQNILQCFWDCIPAKSSTKSKQSGWKRLYLASSNGLLAVLSPENMSVFRILKTIIKLWWVHTKFGHNDAKCHWASAHSVSGSQTQEELFGTMPCWCQKSDNCMNPARWGSLPTVCSRSEGNYLLFIDLYPSLLILTNPWRPPMPMNSWTKSNATGTCLPATTMIDPEH